LKNNETSIIRASLVIFTIILFCLSTVWLATISPWWGTRITRSTNTGGAGLGLAIAKEISTAHGGTITAESNPEHTIFTVKLPL